ncbi:MAG TPA: hypothetical protein VHP58_04990 [Alphaproteobacteria bacterium]|nr:hypothetical protein [Alphaproteobacteria bacterium]
MTATDSRLHDDLHPEEAHFGSRINVPDPRPDPKPAQQQAQQPPGKQQA